MHIKLTAIFLSVVFSTPAFASQLEQDALSETAKVWAQPVKQEANLYRIDPNLYRSEQLTADDAADLEKIGVKSVINLRFSTEMIMKPFYPAVTSRCSTAPC